MARKSRQDSFGFGVELPAVVGRLIDASEDVQAGPPARVDFQHSVLCQVGMPRSRQAGRTFSRTSGTASLLLEAGQLWDGRAWQEQPLPYGTRPRLAMIHVASEAVRTKSRVVDVGDSTHEFLKRLGIDTSGKGYSAFRNQMRALAACRMTLGYAVDNRAVTIDAKPFKRFEAWLQHTDGQGNLWPGEIELSEEFFATLVEHAVPLDYRAVAALSHSALALDVYSWLAHRLHRVARGQAKVSWANMKDQFGQEYRDPKDFKRKFQTALRQVLAVYPDAKVEPTVGGLILRTSPPPIAKK